MEFRRQYGAPGVHRMFQRPYAVLTPAWRSSGMAHMRKPVRLLDVIPAEAGIHALRLLPRE